MTPAQAIVDELERILEGGAKLPRRCTFTLPMDVWERLCYDTSLKDHPDTFWAVEFDEHTFIFRPEGFDAVNKETVQ